MKPIRWPAVFVAAALVVLAPAAWAQQQAPRIGYVFPAGGRQGTTFQVTLGGQFLEGASEAYFSGTGVRAKVIEHFKPLTVAQASLLRDKMKELQEKKAAANRGGPGAATRPAWTAADEEMLVDIRKKLATFIPRNQVNPAIVETVTLEVTIGPEAELAPRDLRLKTPMGLTNPLVFCVGKLPEVSRKLAQVFREPRNGLGPKPPPPEPDMALTLPTVANGQIMPGVIDRYRFQARQGQHLVAAVSARGLMPYL